MTDWEKELKKYLIKKFESILGKNVSINDINIVDIYDSANLDIDALDDKDLAFAYAVDIMREDYNHANLIKDEFKKRECIIEIDINEKEKTGILNVFKIPKKSISFININMKILPSGSMMIDFEKEDL